MTGQTLERMSNRSCDRTSDRPSEEEWLRRISEAVRSVARRRRLTPEQRDDLLSFAVCRLLERGVDWKDVCGVAARPEAYLRRMVERLWIDLTNRRWGRWRPTSRARRLGATGVELDRLIRREGLDLDDAISLALERSSRGRTRDTLYRLASELRPRPRAVPIAGVALTGRDRPDSRLRLKEDSRSLRRALRVLEEEMQQLDDLSRKVLSGRYLEQLTAGSVGRELDLDDRSVYRIAYRALKTLRRRLRDRGVEPGVLGRV